MIKRSVKSYARTTHPLELPALIEVQLNPFKRFVEEGLTVEAVTELGDVVRFGKEDARRRRRWLGSELMDLARDLR